MTRPLCLTHLAVKQQISFDQGLLKRRRHTFTRRDKGVDYDLGAVEEVAELQQPNEYCEAWTYRQPHLRLPYREKVRVLPTDTHFKL
jgi:hypothetical protein